MKRALKSLRAMLTLVLTISAAGCASVDIDRSYINDPQMQLQGPSSVSSPMTGLKNRNQAGGGSSCSVCAH